MGHVPCSAPAEFKFLSPDQTADIGEIVELVCLATGLVPPRVEWFTEDGLGGDGAFASGTGLAVARLNVTASPQR